MAVKAAYSAKSQQLIEDVTKGKEKGKDNKALKETKTYEFYNLEEPGVCIRFCYGDTTKPEKYTFWHGERYELSREIADHVEGRQTPIWAYRPNGEGRMEKSLVGWKPRFQMREVR